MLSTPSRQDVSAWVLSFACLFLAHICVPRARSEQVGSAVSNFNDTISDDRVLAELIGLEVSSAELTPAGSSRAEYLEPNSPQRIALGYYSPGLWWISPADSTELLLEVRRGSINDRRLPATLVGIEASQIDSLTITKLGARVGSIRTNRDNGGKWRIKSIDVKSVNRVVTDKLITRYDSAIVEDLHIRLSSDTVLISQYGTGSQNDYEVWIDGASEAPRIVGRVVVAPDDTLVLFGRNRYLVREHPGERNGRVLQLIRVRKGTNEKEAIMSSLAMANAYHPVPQSLHVIPSCESDARLTIRRASSAQLNDPRGLIVTGEPLQFGMASSVRTIVDLPPTQAVAVNSETVLCTSSVGVRSPSFTLPLWVESSEGRERVGLTGIILKTKTGESLVTISNYLFRVGIGGGQRAALQAGYLATLVISISVLLLIPVLVSYSDDRDNVHHANNIDSPHEVKHWLFSPIRILQLLSSLIGALLIISVNLQLTFATQPWLIGDTRYASRTIGGAITICATLVTAAFVMTWIGRQNHAVAGGARAGKQTVVKAAERWRVGALCCAAFGLTCLIALGQDYRSVDESLWLTQRRSGGGLSFAYKSLKLVAGGLLISTVVVVAAPHAAAISEMFYCLWQRVPAPPQAVRQGRIKDYYLTSVRCVRGVASWIAKTDGRLTSFMLGAIIPLSWGLNELRPVPSLAFHTAVATILTWYVANSWDVAGKSDELQRARSYFAYAGAVIVGSVILFLLFAGRLPILLAYAGTLLAACAFLFASAKRYRAVDVVEKKALGIAIAFVCASFAMITIAVFVNDVGGALASVVALVVGVFTATITKVDEAKPTRQSENEGLYFLGTSAVLGVIMVCGLSALSHLVMVLEQRGILENERIVQRIHLAADASYMSRGEWIVQARWLASEAIDVWRYWVPNEHSDLAIFAINALQGLWPLALVMFALFFIVLLLFLSAEAGIITAATVDPCFRVPMRWASLMLVFASSLIGGQWFVHIAPGVSESMPVTGVALPFAGMGGATHLLFTLIIVVPLVLQTRLLRLASPHRLPSKT